MTQWVEKLVSEDTPLPKVRGQTGAGGDAGLEASHSGLYSTGMDVSPRSSSPASAVGWDQYNFWAVSAPGAAGLGGQKEMSNLAFVTSALVIIALA